MSGRGRAILETDDGARIADVLELRLRNGRIELVIEYRQTVADPDPLGIKRRQAIAVCDEAGDLVLEFPYRSDEAFLTKRGTFTAVLPIRPSVLGLELEGGET